MINQKEMKDFVNLFLEEFNIEYTLDKKNLIYHVKLEEFLAKTAWDMARLQIRNNPIVA